MSILDASRVRAVLGTAGIIVLGAGFAASCTGSKPAHRPEVTDSFLQNAPASRAVVWAVGDAADGRPGASAVAKLIRDADPDLFLYLGDVYPDGSKASFADNYGPAFGALARRTAPTPGNHEWPKRAEGYRPYWANVHGVSPPSYYAVRAGGWELLSLNSEISLGESSPQLRWLRKRLARPGTCRLAFWHRPRWSAGIVHGDDPAIEPLWSALRSRARIVVNGHDHNMQRMRERDGLVELVAGAGGHSGYRVIRQSRLAFSNDTEIGAVRIVLSPGIARVTFVGADGNVLDRSRIGCAKGRG